MLFPMRFGMRRKESSDMKIFNIGGYPPPIGGVSNHIKRLHEHLLSAGWRSVVIDITGVPKQHSGVVGQNAYSLIAFLWRSPSLLHFHKDSYETILLMYALSFRHIVVYSLHDERFMRTLCSLDPLRRNLALRMLRRLRAVITDSSANHSFAAQALGMRNAVMIPEYITAGPPSAHDLAKLDALRNRFGVLLSSNAWQLSFHNDEDLYGLDLLIEMVREISRRHDVGMVFLLPGSAREDYYDALQQRLGAYGIRDRFIFIREPLDEASSLWRISDIVIRATNTDGNSLTIHEALHVGTPVIASDCVPRPEGVILFRNRDASDLSRAVSETIADLAAHKRRVSAMKMKSHAGEIEDLYRRLMEDAG